MSLFSRLLNLSTGSIPREDFFTELVAYLFITNRELLCEWLKCINLSNSTVYGNASVSTQQTFRRLDRHCSDSRPDIVIELTDGADRDIIFIESKIDSQESFGQLSRYAKILADLSGFRSKYLIYITRDFEPKNRELILKEVAQSNVRFKQLRWYQFYQFLKSQADTMLVREIIIFMQEYKMVHNNQFSAIDVLALSNFNNSLNLMKQTMWGEVSKKFREVLGGMKAPSMSIRQLDWHGRYLMWVEMPHGWWCGLGFYLKSANSNDYPMVRLILEVNPKSSCRLAIINTMKNICEEYDWQGYELDDLKAWSRIVREKSLQDFLSEKDHVAAIEEFFLQSLSELDKIKNKFDRLPWGTVDDNESSLDEA